jgi:hypothetical protein
LHGLVTGPRGWVKRLCRCRWWSHSSEWAAEVDVAEVTRLAKTIDRWRVELLAYFRTNRASSGPVEAVNGEIEQVDRIALNRPSRVGQEALSVPMVVPLERCGRRAHR